MDTTYMKNVLRGDDRIHKLSYICAKFISRIIKLNDLSICDEMNIIVAVIFAEMQCKHALNVWENMLLRTQ